MGYIANYKINKKVYSEDQEIDNQSSMLFENLPELIIPQLAAKVLNKSVKTLYDWNYRGETRKSKIPPNLFTKVGGGLYIRKDILGAWMFNRNSSS